MLRSVVAAKTDLTDGGRHLFLATDQLPYPAKEARPRAVSGICEVGSAVSVNSEILRTFQANCRATAIAGQTLGRSLPRARFVKMPAYCVLLNPGWAPHQVCFGNSQP